MNQHEPASPENGLDFPAYITDPDDARRLAEHLAKTALMVGLDTETTGLDPHADKLRLVQLATANQAWAVDLWRAPVDALKPVLEGGKS